MTDEHPDEHPPHALYRSDAIEFLRGNPSTGAIAVFLGEHFQVEPEELEPDLLVQMPARLWRQLDAISRNALPIGQGSPESIRAAVRGAVRAATIHTPSGPLPVAAFPADTKGD